jgi:hypothetical protein
MKRGMIKIEDVQGPVNRLMAEHERVVVSHDGPYVIGMVR